MECLKRAFPVNRSIPATCFPHTRADGLFLLGWVAFKSRDYVDAVRYLNEAEATLANSGGHAHSQYLMGVMFVETRKIFFLFMNQIYG